MSEIRSSVTTIVAEILRVEPGTLETGSNLQDQGLTSLGMIELLGALEDRHRVAIPPHEVTPENFRSVESLSGLLQRLGAA